MFLVFQETGEFKEVLPHKNDKVNMLSLCIKQENANRNMQNYRLIYILAKLNTSTPQIMTTSQSYVIVITVP